MKKYDYLTDYVLKNVWRSPRQDLSWVIEPRRITHHYGDWNTISVGRRLIRLPKPSVRFHVFQYGQIYPLMLGLPNSKDRWTLISETMEQERFIVDIYFKNGLMLPRHKCWYMVTRDNNLIMAIEEAEHIESEGNYGTESIYFRFYTNAYFRSPRSYSQEQRIRVNGFQVENVSQLVALQDEIATYRTKPGAVFTYVNGRFRDHIDPLTSHIGDEVEFIYDSSVKTVVSFRIGSLKQFISQVDNRRKYLLHYPKGTYKNPIIDYRDDLDVYVLKECPIHNGRYDGVYYSHNTADWLRNVTHRDYSIPVQRVEAYIAENPQWEEPKDVTLRLYIRHGGFANPLIFEKNRIHELYRMTDNRISRAMLGIDATVPEWKVETLESSMYTKVMGIDTSVITRDMMEQTLGYNSISKIIGDTPSKFTRVNGAKVVEIPYGLQAKSTGFEYDNKGKLLAYHPHVSTSLYPARDENSEFVEIVANYGDMLLDEYYGTNIVQIEPGYQFRCYVCPLVAGRPNNEWVDVTDSALYSVVNGVLTWFVDETQTYTLVRTNKQNLTYDITITPFAGNTYFTLRQQSYRQGSLMTHDMQIPMGELDIWANSHSLIEGVDYIMDFPEVILIGKRWLKAPQNGPQKLTIRFTNFCDSFLKHNRRADTGYVDHGVLSHNNRYDIRDDKVVRIVIGGSTYRRENLKFAENSGLVTVPHELNGLPYSIRDVVVPTRGLIDRDPYEMKQEALETDKRVSDYLSMYFPMPVSKNPNAAQGRYPVLSPFINAILNDLKDGILDDPRFDDNYNDMVAKEIAQPYETYLRFDPTQPGNELDPTYTVCVPHPYDEIVQLELRQFRFLDRCVKLYSRGLIQLSHYVALKPF